MFCGLFVVRVVILWHDSDLQEISFVGDAEKFLLQRKVSLQSALARLLVRKKMKRVEDLLDHYQTPGMC